MATRADAGSRRRRQRGNHRPLPGPPFERRNFPQVETDLGADSIRGPAWPGRNAVSAGVSTEKR